MAAIVKLPSGNWRAQVRRKRSYVSNTFRRRADAEAWALEVERTIDKGLDPKATSPKQVHTFSDIVDLHVRDMQEVGKKIGRSKEAVLKSLKISLGMYRVEDINRTALIEYGKKRAKAGAGPATLAIDLSFIGTLLTHAAAVHGVTTSPQEVKLARVALADWAWSAVQTNETGDPTQAGIGQAYPVLRAETPPTDPDAQNHSICSGNGHEARRDM